jgi:hypothetical protein
MPRQAAYDPPREPYKVFREENHGHRVLSDTIEAFRGINPEAFRNPDFNEPLDVRNGNLEAFPDQGTDRVVDSGRLELSPWLKSRMNGTMHVWNEYFASMPGLYVNCDEYGNEDPEAWQGKPPAGFVNNGEGNAFLHVVRTGVTPAPHPAPPSQEAYPRYAPEAYGKPPEPPRKPAQPAAGAPRPGGMRLNPPRV